MGAYLEGIANRLLILLLVPAPRASLQHFQLLACPLPLTLSLALLARLLPCSRQGDQAADQAAGLQGAR